ncbi:MAG: hypothetical protein KBG28_00205 [Kofleriaceae bacterium]|nr:hypothetical protein [Kofleriaceae bacterium]MBP6839334.1 hypothetical protein [Kofleriaceae bacterium]MBP9202369.1 hypothetical protein [Kofleriaceae bacterium]
MTTLRSILLLAAISTLTGAAGASAGCTRRGGYVQVDQAPLGRVVVYRNGVAFYERRAIITDGRLVVTVPRDRVDDFLKSMTVVDRVTRKPLPVVIPRQQDAGGETLTMTLRTPSTRTADVLLTYVTEAPAWKPSYRVVVGGDGKVMLEGWAIVDNTSGEDWRAVRVGVGASSALSFRYDLWSVRSIERDLLADQERFAVAPPTARSTFASGPGAAPAGGPQVSDVMLDLIPTGRTFSAALGSAAGSQADGVAFSGSSSLENQYFVDGVTTGETITITDAAPSIDPTTTALSARPGGDNLPTYTGSGASARPAKAAERAAPRPAPVPRLVEVARQLMRDRSDVLIESLSDPGRDPTGAEASARANQVRNHLIDAGVAPARIRVEARREAGTTGRVRLLAVATTKEAPAEEARPAGGSAVAATPAAPGDSMPVGESHFLSEQALDVEAGSSAMVSMVRAETTGGVVYLYDPTSERGNTRYAFRAVRLDNPTGDTLEPGPVTVYGDGRFIGEGLTEPVPPHAPVVIPFALDRQIIVERRDDGEDQLARVVSIERGVLTAEMQRIRRAHFTVTSRLTSPATVYLRHRLEDGWALTEAPSKQTRAGDAHLFELTLAPGQVAQVVIAEATPIERSLQLTSIEAMSKLSMYVESKALAPELEAALGAVLATHRKAADLVERIATLRRQQAEYRGRSAELATQLVALEAVKTGRDLLRVLRGKQADILERSQRLTIAVVDAEEALMLARVQYADQLAELRLPDARAATPGPVATPSPRAASR